MYNGSRDKLFIPNRILYKEYTSKYKYCGLDDPYLPLDVSKSVAKYDPGTPQGRSMSLNLTRRLDKYETVNVILNVAYEPDVNGIIKPTYTYNVMFCSMSHDGYPVIDDNYATLPDVVQLARLLSLHHIPLPHGAYIGALNEHEVLQYGRNGGQMPMTNPAKRYWAVNCARHMLRHLTRRFADATHAKNAQNNIQSVKTAPPVAKEAQDTGPWLRMTLDGAILPPSVDDRSNKADDMYAKFNYAAASLPDGSTGAMLDRILACLDNTTAVLAIQDESATQVAEQCAPALPDETGDTDCDADTLAAQFRDLKDLIDSSDECVCFQSKCGDA